MPETFDLYTDVFTVTVTPWGANLSFQLREAHPSPASIQQPSQLGTVRMSNEHLKTMIFILRQQMRLHEEAYRTSYDVPTEILSQLGIAREDWDSFWV